MKQHIKAILKDFYKNGDVDAHRKQLQAYLPDGAPADAIESVMKEFAAGGFTAEGLDSFADKVMAIEPAKPQESICQTEARPKRNRIAEE